MAANLKITKLDLNKDLNEFKNHVISFPDIKIVAVQKEIGQSFDINIARISKNS